MDFLSKIALALDLPSEKDLINILTSLQPQPKIVKIGLEIIYALGLENCLNLVAKYLPNADIFLDLKLHDIPNTVAQAVLALTKFKVKYLTVHALGGQLMLEKALEKTKNSDINLVAITVLTSHSEENLKKDFDLPANFELFNLSQKLAKISLEAGLKYIVCSAHESKLLKQKFSQLKTITPGIRLPDKLNSVSSDDQARIITPSIAFSEANSDLIVIGRPIYQAPNPQSAWTELLKSCNNN